MNSYVIVLGSNLPSEFGNSFETLKKCVYEIKSDLSIKSLSTSNWYKSLSFPDRNEPKFTNVGIHFYSNLTPKQLLNLASSLEEKYGRKREGRWKARTCDIDILLCDQLILPSKLNYEKWMRLELEDQLKLIPNELILPHPRMQERPFFLKPLSDLQPKWIHPFLKKTAKEMLDSLPLNELQSIKKIKC